MNAKRIPIKRFRHKFLNNIIRLCRQKLFDTLNVSSFKKFDKTLTKMLHIRRKLFWIHFIIIISSLQGLKMRLFTFRKFPKALMNLFQAKMFLRRVISKMILFVLVGCMLVKMKFLMRMYSITLELRMGMNVESLIKVTKVELDTMWMEKFTFRRMDQQAKRMFIKALVDERAF